MSGTVDGLVAVGTPIDLDNCAREPIHIPGLIQPRGVLLVVREPDLVISQVSTNLLELLDVDAAAVLEQPLSAALGVEAAAVVAQAVTTFGELRERNPHDVTITVRDVAIVFDAILHRQPGSALVVELEPASGPRPFSFPNTYRSVRSAVAELSRAASLAELFEITARSVRELTGFDRVMVYRYDAEYNGEVVAEDKRADLNSFLGQHYPASDIPAQARALYEKNWIRLIDDIGYTPVPILPVDSPDTGAPLDLTHSTLRSVSPIHVEYLQNMGVHASMSISLLREGKLWGLIACHHYAGPHLPPYGVRAAAEFLGATLSIRLVDRYDDDDLRERLAAQEVLTKLTSGALAEAGSIVSGLLGSPGLADLIECDGVAVRLGNEYASSGTVPDEAMIRTIAVAAAATDGEVLVTDSLGRDLPMLQVSPSIASGALVISLPDGQYIAWVRSEVEQSVDWGGDPHNKAIAVREGDAVRLSPRKSFERWREVVRGRSKAWAPHERELAVELRRHTVDSLYARARDEVRLAERLQRSLLPPVPSLARWGLSAHYEPAAGGQIGGDWYDAFEMRGGGLAVVLGDVAGHGIEAAGAMAQLRNVLRAYLIDGAPPEQAITRLNQFLAELVPGAFATIAVAAVDQDTGRARLVCAGHPPPFVIDADGGVAPVASHTSPPLGVLGATYLASEFVLEPGNGLVLYSDGLIERRDEQLDTGLDRLASVLRRLSGNATARQIFTETTGSIGTADDATVLYLSRPA